MADVAVLTPSVLTPELVANGLHLVSKDGRLVCTGVAQSNHPPVPIDLIELAMYNKAILGTNFGSSSPRVTIPKLLELNHAGLLMVEELITREYALDDVEQGYADMLAGRNIRGVVKF